MPTWDDLSKSFPRLFKMLLPSVIPPVAGFLSVSKIELCSRFVDPFVNLD